MIFKAIVGAAKVVKWAASSDGQKQIKGVVNFMNEHKEEINNAANFVKNAVSNAADKTKSTIKTIINIEQKEELRKQLEELRTKHAKEWETFIIR